jgi:sRNA-binding regulator protein Hfq
VKVFLAARNVSLKGRLESHDAEAIVLDDDEGVTLVFKSQIISIVRLNATEVWPPAAGDP